MCAQAPFLGFVCIILAISASAAPDLRPVDLCDCHFADASDGSNTQLSCERDGFFVAGFRAAGYMSGRMDELLPLSPSICCRPCVSNATAATSETLAADKPVAVLTGNCHAADVGEGERCGSATTSGFIQGFQHGQVGTPVSFYPYGSAQCCTPTVLLASGNVLPLQRCECEEDAKSPTHISCGTSDTPEMAQQDGRLIFGFQRVHDVYGRYPVPSAHAQCCRACVDVAAAGVPAEHCEHLNKCNGRGQCLFGQCECADGWSGEQCDVSPRKAKPHTEHSRSWPISMIVLLASIATCMFRLLLCTCDRRRRAILFGRRAQPDVEEALLHPEEPETSAEEWSTDFDDEDEEEAAPPPPRRSAPVPIPNDSAARPDAPTDPAEAEGETVEGAAPAEEMVDCSEAGPTPGQPMECLVCMSERIQVVCVPCGHACMCRKCSRRLRRCPLCRKEVTRRQKLFLSLDE